MRSFKDTPEEAEATVLAATDPANPYGTMLKWPAGAGEGPASRGPTRSVGSLVVLVNGALAAYLGRGGRQLLVFLPEDEPARGVVGRALAARLARLARIEDGRGGLLISEINGVKAADHPLAPFLIESGFYASPMGFQMRTSSATRKLALAEPSSSSLASGRSHPRGSRLA
jgi:ATP-dependent Lhr-like helicase